MRSLKDQLVEKGIVEKPEKVPVQEAYTGETALTVQQEIGAISKSIYRPKQKLWDHKQRHGRTVHLEVPKMEKEKEKKEVNQESNTYKLLQIVREKGPLSVDQLGHVAKERGVTLTKGSLYLFTSQGAIFGILQRSSIVGERGAGYSLNSQYMDLSVAYRKYYEEQGKAQKKYPKKKEPAEGPLQVQGVRSGAQKLQYVERTVIPQNITVTVNHKVDIYFHMEPPLQQKKK